MIKYLYVLVSDENDYYLEQALMSITSLKIYTPDAFVSFLIDNTTEKTLIGKRRNILGLINELKVIEIEERFDKKARSRWLKTSMRQHIDGVFLFIDCDTIICDNLNDIESISADIGAVLDLHHLIKDSPGKKRIQNNDRKLGFTASYKSDKHFNSGVIFCKNTDICYSFFNEWHSLWIKGNAILDIDQPSFNQANQNFNNIVEEITGIWNCQINTGGIVFLVDAKIIHYFSAKKVNNYNILYTLADISILQKIKESYVIDDEIKNCLLHPKNNFYLHTQLLTNKKIIGMLHSRAFKLFWLIYCWKYFKIIEKLLDISINIISKINIFKKNNNDK
jgi:hypothetical protein